MSQPSPSDIQGLKIATGVFAILLGFLGIHKFILGRTSEGILMLVVSLVTGLCCAGLGLYVMWIIGLIEGIIYLTKTDEEFYQIYVVGKRPWF